MRKALLAVVTGLFVTVLGAGPALACGGLIGRNGSVNLVRTTTLAAWHDGVEHYVTAFKFAGAGGEFGSIIPLPDVPTSVERGGDWTLQRLVREVTPQPRFARESASSGVALAADAQVLLETRIDALDITVLKGGGQAVGEWATKNGFLLTPDIPEVLDFYAQRSPIFLAARFNGDAARQKGVALGDGTPVHLTIPTANPWVPLRILGVGLKAGERVNADVFLLTDKRPALLPGKTAPGMVLDRQAPASSTLLTDLRTDKGMEWVPQSAWLSYLKIDAAPGQLTYDLAVDATGADKPSPVAAGLELAQPAPAPAPGPVAAATPAGMPVWPWAVAGLALAATAGGVLVATPPAVKLLAGVAVAALLTLSGCAGGPSERTIELTVHHSQFSLAELHVRPGETVRFVVRNTDPIPHELIVGDQSVQDVHEAGTESHHGARAGEVSVAPGATAVTTYRFAGAGSIVLFGCHLPGHWAYGMKGTIRVA